MYTKVLIVGRVWLSTVVGNNRRTASPCILSTGLILGSRPANERRRYKVTPSLIGWAQTLNQLENIHHLCQPCMQPSFVHLRNLQNWWGAFKCPIKGACQKQGHQRPKSKKLGKVSYAENDLFNNDFGFDFADQTPFIKMEARRGLAGWYRPPCPPSTYRRRWWLSNRQTSFMSENDGNFNTSTRLAPVRYGRNVKSIILKFTIQNSSLGTHCKIALRWMPENPTSGNSTLVQMLGVIRQQVITWANVSTNLCRHMSSLGHNWLRPRQNGQHFADDTFKSFLDWKMVVFRLKFHWNLFPVV